MRLSARPERRADGDDHSAEEPEATEPHRLAAEVAQGRIAGFENVDPALEGALAGAKRARERAAEAVRRFASEHLDDLAAERLRDSEAVARRAHETLRAAESASIAWRAESAEWAVMLREAGREDLLGELPESPFHNLPRPGTEPPSPAPAALSPAPAALSPAPAALSPGKKTRVPTRGGA